MDNNTEILELDTNKEIFKVLSIKDGNNIALYSLKYKEKNIRNLIENIKNRYTLEVIDKIETEFCKTVPLSYGKYDKIKNGHVKKYEILEIKENNDSEFFFPTNKTGRIKLTFVYDSELANIIEETFLKNKKILLNMTKIIKYKNNFFNQPNNFRFDKTIDLFQSKNEWQQSFSEIKSINDYEKYLNNLSKNLNDNTINLNEKEQKKIRETINEFMGLYQSVFEVEQIGMFPLYSVMSKKYAVLSRYGLRNEQYDWHFNVLDNCNINNNGGAIINEISNTLETKYDLDASLFEKNIINRLQSEYNEKDFQKDKNKINTYTNQG
ncbi:MAG: hypothetical protein RSB77_05615 [Bacilli bacterium]